MNYLRQIERGIDYIEAHLDEEISPGDVARHAGISQWHFQRIFKSLTNETLKTYIRSRRFAAALTMLDDVNVPVIQIALASGFDTQESFTRAFKVAFGVTPGAYRKSRSAMRFQRKARFDGDYLRHLHERVSIEPNIEDEPSRRLVGMTTSFFGADSEKSNFAAALPALWGSFLPRAGELGPVVPGAAYGVVRIPDEGDELHYMAAFEVQGGAPIPPGMEEFELPAARYARFAHRGLAAKLDQTLNYIYSSWLLKSGMRHTSGCDVEVYGAAYVPNSESSVFHYGIPVAADAEPRIKDSRP